MNSILLLEMLKSYDSEVVPVHTVNRVLYLYIYCNGHKGVVNILYKECQCVVPVYKYSKEIRVLYLCISTVKDIRMLNLYNVYSYTVKGIRVLYVYCYKATAKAKLTPLHRH